MPKRNDISKILGPGQVPQRLKPGDFVGRVGALEDALLPTMPEEKDSGDPYGADKAAPFQSI